MIISKKNNPQDDDIMVRYTTLKKVNKLTYLVLISMPNGTNEIKICIEQVQAAIAGMKNYAPSQYNSQN